MTNSSLRVSVIFTSIKESSHCLQCELADVGMNGKNVHVMIACPWVVCIIWMELLQDGLNGSYLWIFVQSFCFKSFFEVKHILYNSPILNIQCNEFQYKYIQLCKPHHSEWFLNTSITFRSSLLPFVFKSGSHQSQLASPRQPGICFLSP